MRIITKRAIILLITFSVAAFAQQKGTFKDTRDGKTYKTVKIGVRTWMAENLSYNATGSKCYDNKPANCTKYGKLYDWETAKTACPKGWLLSSEYALKELMSEAGTGSDVTSLRTKGGWKDNGNYVANAAINGTDKFGFSAPPGGYFFDGKFLGVGEFGFLWAATDSTTLEYWFADPRLIATPSWSFGVESAQFSVRAKGGELYSVRCVKDDEANAKAEAEAAAKAAADAEALVARVSAGDKRAEAIAKAAAKAKEAAAKAKEKAESFSAPK